jgi:hypothetical protein
MSDRLTIAAALSILMMSIYVLFGADATHIRFTGDHLSSPISVPAPEVSIDTGKLLPFSR